MPTTYAIYLPRHLQDAIEPLVQQKQRKGYTVAMHYVDDIAGSEKYRQMRREILSLDPDDYLLLVGDHDAVPGYPQVNDHDASNSKTFLSDAFFSVQDGRGNFIPRVPTGRISSNVSDVVRRVCETLVEYPTNTRSGWRQHALLVGWVPHEPGDANYEQDAAVQWIREGGHYFKHWFEFERSGTPAQRQRWHVGTNSKDTLINALNIGHAIVRYLGHGLPDAWDNVGDNEAFTCSDIDRVDPAGRLPLILSATCLTGDIAASPSLAERWQTACKAVGVWAADTVSSTYFNDRITQCILHQVVSERERSIGRVLLGALRRLDTLTDWGALDNASKIFLRKTVLMYRYLGDPDTALAVPAPRKATLHETSTNGPALASRLLGFRPDVVLLAWTGAPTNLQLNFMTSTDGLNYSGKVTLDETSPYSPALTTWQDKFVVAWVGVGNNKINIMQSEDGRNWSQKVTLNERSWHSPTLTGFGDHLYLAWRGGPTNGLINILRSSDGISWDSKVVTDITTTSGPTLTATVTNLILAWRGGPTNNRLNVAISSDGRMFSSPRTLSDTTTTQPSLGNYLGRPMLAWAGVNNQWLNVLEGEERADYRDTQWGAKITWPEKCIDRPVLAVCESDLICAWTGTDGRLNTMLYPVAPI